MATNPSDRTERRRWYGRRRAIPLWVIAVANWGYLALTAQHTGQRLVDVAFVIYAFSGIYRSWTNPTPPAYLARQEKLKNEPPFGTKLWHKFAIGFRAAFVLLIVGVLISSAFSG